MPFFPKMFLKFYTKLLGIITIIITKDEILKTCYQQSRYINTNFNNWERKTNVFPQMTCVRRATKI